MATFVVLYSGGKTPATPQEGEASMKEWEAWFKKVGKSVTEMGAPFGKAVSISSAGVKDGGGGNVSNGYSVVEAKSLADAAKMLSGCPIIAEGGKVHVFELMAM
jgi:hypothetical protein